MPSRARCRRVDLVCEALFASYGWDRLGNPIEPVDDLLFIMLSNRARPGTARKVYDELKGEFGSWSQLAEASVSEVESIIRPAGLGFVKADQILGTVRRLKEDFGCPTLGPLKEDGQDAALGYLRTLPGVSEKVARCVMMYTMGEKVLPVDVHVHRIAVRLGWTAHRRADQSHAELEALVPALNRPAFHVDCILHGRAICRRQKPKCSECCIGAYCEVGL